MKRDVDSILLQWKDEIRRLPLLVRGARQVGVDGKIKKHQVIS